MPAPDYGFYIWSAYGVTALVAATLLLWALRDHRAQLRALAAFEEPRSGPGGRSDV
ncbi:heme exporter protein CcmD [Enterovirga sp.]|jgi:heme exporter protein CcmD|uniref:heme exporter protein CcmD n=1 Tax=Enterovirga sp. TaxID=2026350 RepID=UPI00261AE886|nr:heme exporter protein CcmD [Enterovirga sp.]MDB5590055.1 hypothetical protein [Enterovirga sp.]